MGSVSPLLGRSVLIVEDEPLIALEILEELRLAGASIIAATNIRDALTLIAHAHISAAIVDVTLDVDGCDCSSICAALAKRSIPFIFYTGHSSAPALSAWPHAPAVTKPVPCRILVDALVDLIPSGVRRLRVADGAGEPKIPAIVSGAASRAKR